MNSRTPPPTPAIEVLAAAIRRRSAEQPSPMLVAIDGRSGSGKSAIAMAVAQPLSAAVIPVDDFFDATISDTGWDSRSPAERAADALDWRRANIVPIQMI